MSASYYSDPNMRKKRQNSLSLGDTSMLKKPLLILTILTAAVLTVFLYVLFHELGHLIVMLSAGAEILDFSILHAHVSAVGGSYTDFSHLWLHANGAFLPLLLSWVYVLFFRRKKKNAFYRAFSWFVGLLPAGSMLAWVIIPAAYLYSRAPIGDDVTNFTAIFSYYHHPLYISLAALLLMLISFVLMACRGVIGSFVSLMRENIMI